MAAPGKNTAVLDSVTAPLRKYLDDERVTELVINRPGEVGIERRGGVDGRVNNFFWQRFGTALLFSLVEDAATVGTEAVGSSASNTTRVPSDAASTILQQNGQIKPVMRKNQGEDVGITVAQDFDFSTVYGLSLK